MLLFHLEDRDAVWIIWSHEFLHSHTERSLSAPFSKAIWDNVNRAWDAHDLVGMDSASTIEQSAFSEQSARGKEVNEVLVCGMPGSKEWLALILIYFKVHIDKLPLLFPATT